MYILDLALQTIYNQVNDTKYKQISYLPLISARTTFDPCFTKEIEKKEQLCYTDFMSSELDHLIKRYS